MSTELKTHPHNPVDMTRHSMGSEKGVGVQLTHFDSDGRRRWISVSREEAVYLAHDLVAFSLEREEESDE